MPGLSNRKDAGRHFHDIMLILLAVFAATAFDRPAFAQPPPPTGESLTASEPATTNAKVWMPRCKQFKEEHPTSHMIGGDGQNACLFEDPPNSFNPNTASNK